MSQIFINLIIIIKKIMNINLTARAIRSNQHCNLIKVALDLILKEPAI